MAYGWLSRHLPRWLATALTGLWFAGLIWALFFALVADEANFRYWRM